MIKEKYDVIIVGAGLSGLTIGAVLSSREKKDVLILEREDYIGGRIVSFTGEDDGIVLQGKKLGQEGFKKVLSSVYTWVSRSEPDLETMLKNRLLDGYSFEAGGHATFWGLKGRVAHLLNYLGKAVDLPGNEGFAVMIPEMGKLFPMEKGGRYEWMSMESNRTAKSMLREMIMATDEVMKEWDAISFGQWITDRTEDRTVYEFLAAVASIHMVMGEPLMIPAGDFIRFMRTATMIGMNLISGSTGIVPKPGFGYIAERIAEAVEESGGTIANRAGVSEIIVEDGRVGGVKVRLDGVEKTIAADKVVCTVPVKKIWSFLPETFLPDDLVEKIKSEFFSVGMLTGYMGLKTDILAEAGLNPKSWILVPSIIKAEEGYIGDVDIISIMPSNFAPSLAPEGRYSLGFSIALTDGELRDKKKVDRVIDTARKIFFDMFPSLEANKEWEFWTCSDKGFGDWPPPGEGRPDTILPGLDGLFFAGDGYGAATWGSGMDAAVYSALLCIDAVTQGNYVEEVMPEYHR
ncbi:MAG: NAD(P)/FAD-dependent oxidoreductase [Proteobacteria bacterium]|nr:NAD(P)/FAD-dependent oxidoreductase [Pseudomonadota bacterium]